ncbi:hypothetical protein AB5I41_04860 [Sphingomonas sp. MMS24-JH45]
MRISSVVIVLSALAGCNDRQADTRVLAKAEAEQGAGGRRRRPRQMRSAAR